MARTRAEIGSVGLPLFSGHLSLDPNTRLRGARGVKLLRELAFDEPAGSAFLAACHTLLRTDLQVEAAGTTDPDKRAAEFLQTCLDDMREGLPTYLRQMYSMIWAGWDVHEVVYKRRTQGRYTDGKVGWAHFGLRRQETLDKWGVDKNGWVSSFVQRPAPDYVIREIPLTKAVHLVADDTEGSPEGKSALRGMYKPAYFVKNLELLWGISLERFGTGIPVFEVQEGVPSLTDAQTQTLADIAAGLRQNEEAFVITPAGIKFRFEQSPGLNADNYRSAILFFRTWALSTALGEFITLGTGDTGSFALGTAKIDLFLKALTGYQDRLCGALNRQAVTRLFRYNDFGKLTDMPRVTLPAVREYDLQGLATFTEILSRIGIFHPTPADEGLMRKISDLPDIDDKTLAKMFAVDAETANDPTPPPEGTVQTGQDTVENADNPDTAEQEVA